MNILFRHVMLSIPVEYANLLGIPLRNRSDEDRDTNVLQHMANSTRPQERVIPYDKIVQKNHMDLNPQQC